MSSKHIQTLCNVWFSGGGSMGWFQVESIVESSEQVFGGISFSHISPTHVKKKTQYKQVGDVWKWNVEVHFTMFHVVLC